MSSEIKIDEKNFQKEVIESQIPVLADFWAEWCVPCRMISPMIQEIAEEYNGKIKIAKINIDESPNLAVQNNITSIPTIIIFNKGEIHNRQVGAVSKASLENLFKDLL